MTTIMTFSEVGGFDFKQLTNGKWVGISMEGLFTSVDIFEIGVYPSRFKYLEVVESSDDEINEYFN